MKAESTAMTHRPRDRVPSGSMLALPDPRRPDRANPPPQTFDDPPFFFFFFFFFWQHWHDLHALGSHWTVNKEYYVEVLREFRQRFCRKRPALFKSGQWHFHQDNAPVHNSILVTEYLTKMGIKTVPQPPYSPDLARCDFWLFPKLRSCYETIKEMKEAVMKVIDMLTQEDFHGAFQKLLEWYNKCIAAGEDYFEEDEFHVYTINKCPYKKSLETYLMMLVNILKFSLTLLVDRAGNNLWLNCRSDHTMWRLLINL